MRTIVVGVDGSASSRRAFEWAIEEARLYGDEILAVHAWTYPLTAAPSGAVFTQPPMGDLRRDAIEFLQREIEEVTGGDETMKIHLKAVQGSPAYALLNASAGADMIVIGSRGYGGFRGLLLGSVGHQLAQHGRCPVVIIPHDERAAS